MCFNLFGPLVADREGASRLFGAQVREVDEILGGEIELRPQENPLKDGSAFDAFFEYVDLDGQRAFLGIETKLTDKFSSKRYEYEGHPGYGEFTRRADSAWTKESWERLPEPAYNQLWRNHLLTEATKRLPESPYGRRGMSILVHHPSDKFAAKVAEEYREFLSDPVSFQVWRLDDLLATWSTLELSPAETDWLEKIQDRYLRLELSESDWKEHQPPPSAGAEPSATDPEHFDLPEQWREFKKWIGQNYEGFVLNERSKIDFMLHRASCGTLLFGPNDSAVLKPKHCSTKKRVLIEWAEARSSVVPPNCENCAP